MFSKPIVKFDYVMDIVFGLDMIFNFFCAYLNPHDDLVVSFKKIAKK